jgi:hypothetical protein
VSKYGLCGAPMHLQAVESLDSAPAIEAASLPAEVAPVEPDPVLEQVPAIELDAAGFYDDVLLYYDTHFPDDTAVAAPSNDAPAEPAPVELAPAETPPVLESVVGPAVHAPPAAPNQAELKILKPPAPADPLDVSDDEEGNVAAVHATASQAVAARHTIQSTMLALARQIRKPKAYVGYSAFILMGLKEKRQPFVFEGSVCIDLLDVFAPWAKDADTNVCHAAAIPCAIVAGEAGSCVLVPISDVNPLMRTSHYVAGLYGVAGTAVADHNCSFDIYYNSLGVAIIGTCVDGDCGLDAMLFMLGRPSTLAARTALRIEISDYLYERLMAPWMHDLMVACAELRLEDVQAYRNGEFDDPWDCRALVAPLAPSPAVAEPTAPSAASPVLLDGDTFKAMRWASGLASDLSVVSLIRALPSEIVDEQVCLYHKRSKTTDALVHLAPRLLESDCSKISGRALVARRFHAYLKTNDIVLPGRMPYGKMHKFIASNFCASFRVRGCQIRSWYATWSKDKAQLLAAESGDAPPQTAPTKRSLLKSRSKVPLHKRKRSEGAGAKFKHPLIRQELYEWWSAIRYSIDWTQLIADRRSRGHKLLARFPQSSLLLKVQQLQEEYAYACMVNGSPVQSITPDSHWFKRWAEDYGLSMRMANRKYAVPRNVLKERLEIFWVSLFRMRYFILLVFGYDPRIENWDQSPFHHNETGAQNKPTLAVRGSVVPVVEGTSDVKSRWTVNLCTRSDFDAAVAVADGANPAGECMFKAERDGSVDARLQAFLRSRGFPSWFTVTVGPKGSYRELDIISFLEKHLEEWTDGRDWRILLCDDYSAHKTANVWALCWSRGYILIVHGGGATPVAQTVDTDLNQHVRRRYGEMESRLLLAKMRAGAVVPKLTHEECMDVMFQVLSDPELHKDAAEGYKRVGQSNDLHGGEDSLICREAGTYWRSTTTDGLLNMRVKIDAALAIVKDEVESKGLMWCQEDVRRLIQPYPTHKKVDAILANLGEDFGHDVIHNMDAGDDDGDDAGHDMEDQESIADADGSNGYEKHSAVAGDGGESADGAGDRNAEVEGSDVEIELPVSTDQADAVQRLTVTRAALQGALDGLLAIGHVRGVHQLEESIKVEMRRERALINASPAVAASFLRLRRAEARDDDMRIRAAKQHADRKRDAAKAIADRDTAVADLKRTKKIMQEMEGIRETRHAIKSFPLDALGAGSPNAGGKQGKRNRFEVLDRLARHGAGLSPGQRNDWAWFKAAWDTAMVTQHRAGWAKLFSEWLQSVLEEGPSNSFSKFVHRETCRVFAGSAALHVPGS